jgi:hypothetical protein
MDDEAREMGSTVGTSKRLEFVSSGVFIGIIGVIGIPCGTNR